MKQILIALDQVLNTVVWIKGDGFGYADETLSARAWRLRHQSNAWKRIDALFFWDEDHCYKSYRSEVLRKHLPNRYTEAADD
jgi:hypothetical protein